MSSPLPTAFVGVNVARRRVGGSHSLRSQSVARLGAHGFVGRDARGSCAPCVRLTGGPPTGSGSATRRSKGMRTAVPAEFRDPWRAVVVYILLARMSLLVVALPLLGSRCARSRATGNLPCRRTGPTFQRRALARGQRNAHRRSRRHPTPPPPQATTPVGNLQRSAGHRLAGRCTSPFRAQSLERAAAAKRI